MRLSCCGRTRGPPGRVPSGQVPIRRSAWWSPADYRALGVSEPRTHNRSVGSYRSEVRAGCRGSILRVIYVSYDGALDPLGASQVVPYLLGLAERGVAVTLVSFEKSTTSP